MIDSVACDVLGAGGGGGVGDVAIGRAGVGNTEAPGRGIPPRHAWNGVGWIPR